ncbi:hypothetical protein A2U01_0055300 [Trifolium medium]|uniref:Uncharacterized protein n=1 Tax=Trifolium medium TaxID=97028 RepID=A0A392RD68_9FABA|nr:hypothetical protein [Trifolium medium]
MEESCLACGKASQGCADAIMVTQACGHWLALMQGAVISMAVELPEKANMEVAP